MQIEYFGVGEFKIKTQKALIKTSEKCFINDFALPGPGEYEIAGVRVESIDATVIFEVDKFILAHLDKRKKPFTEDELEKIGKVDILFIPVGGENVFTPKEALEAVKLIEPKIVIPMHYKDISEFKRMEGISPEILDDLKLKGELTEDEPRRIIILNAKASKTQK
jgi:hypothetical protein